MSSSARRRPGANRTWHSHRQARRDIPADATPHCSRLDASHRIPRPPPRPPQVNYVKGAGKLLGNGVVEATLADGTKQQVKGKHIILATGSEVTPLPGVPIDEKRIVSSTGAIALTGARRGGAGPCAYLPPTPLAPDASRLWPGFRLCDVGMQLRAKRGAVPFPALRLAGGPPRAARGLASRFAPLQPWISGASISPFASPLAAQRSRRPWWSSAAASSGSSWGPCGAAWCARTERNHGHGCLSTDSP